MNSISSASSFASSATAGPAPSEPPVIIQPGPTCPPTEKPKTGPGPVVDAIETSSLAEENDLMFAMKTTVDCPPGTKPTVTVDGQQVVVVCEPPKKTSPSGGPILESS
jgi:hypothetical protein